MLHKNKKFSGSCTDRAEAKRPSRRDVCPLDSIDLRRARREAGSIFPLVAVAATTLVLFLALALDSGRLYLARTQIQGAADNAARAALRAAYDPAQTTGADARAAGRRAAIDVLAGNSVIDGGVDLSGGDLSFGTFANGAFTADSGSARPSAVRVQLRRTRQSGDAIDGTFMPMGVAAEAVASLQCRQVAVVVDLSASFEEELGRAQAALRGLVDQFEEGAGRGDSLALVTFNGAGTDNDGAAGRLEVELKKVTASSEGEFRSHVNNLQTCPRPSGLPLPACTGTNPSAGLAIAREQLRTPTPECNGERLILLISDGVPCSYDPARSPQENQRRTEALVQSTIAEVEAAEQEGISVSTIFVYDEGSGGGGGGRFGGLFGFGPGSSGGSCPSTPAGESDPDFAESLTRGDIGQYFSNENRESLTQLLALAAGSFPIVMVR